MTNREMSAHVPDGTDPWLIEEAAAEVNRQAAEFAALPVEGNTPAALVYTSGTTGHSKGAVLSHENFAANATVLNTCWRMNSDDRMLLGLPLFHVHGLGNAVHTWLTTGYRVRLLERFRKETIFRRISRLPADGFLWRPHDV